MAESLVRALRDRGNDVRVVTTGWRGQESDRGGNHPEVLCRLPARRVPKSRLVMGLPNTHIAYSPANRRRVLSVVKQFKPAVIHQLSHIHDVIFLSAYAALKTGTPLVGGITTPIQFVDPILHRLARIADLAVVYEFGVRHWQRIICTDSAQAAFVLDQYGSRIAGRLVEHIFVGLHQRMAQQSPSARTSWPQIVTVGHVHQGRNPTKLISAMPQILEQFPDAKLDIAGRVQFDQPVREVKRLGLENSVRFLGQVSTERVVELVSKAHVFAVLHQWRYAGLSFTAIEAMAFGTPVVINAPRGLYGPGALVDGRDIILVDCDDVTGIAERITRLLSDESMRSCIGQNGRKFVQKYLTWERCAEKMEALYRELL